MRFAFALTVASILSCVTAGCSEAEEPEPPTPPDLTALIQTYQQPTAEFDETVLDDLVNEITNTVEELVTLDEVRSIIEDLVESVVEEDATAAARVAPDIGTTQQPVTLSGDGFVTLNHICHGFGPDAPVDEDENGRIELNARFSEGGLEPVVWGTMTDCKYTLSGDDLQGDVRLHGSLSMDLGNLGQIGSVPTGELGTIGSLPILFELALELDVDGESLIDNTLDFRVCREASEETDCLGAGVEFAVELSDGTHWVLFVTTDRLSGGIRASNDTWLCSFMDNGCTSQNTDETVTIPDFSF